MLLGTLEESLLGNVLAGKGIDRAGEGTGYGNKKSQERENKIDFWCCLILHLILK